MNMEFGHRAPPLINAMAVEKRRLRASSPWIKEAYRGEDYKETVARAAADNCCTA